MDSSDELIQIATGLRAHANNLEREDVKNPVNRLNQAFQKVNAAFSGSWLGYHSRLYYSDFESAPSSDAFSKEWGLMERISTRRYESRERGWTEYDRESVRSRMLDRAGMTDLDFDGLLKFSSAAAECLRSSKKDAESVLQIETDSNPDSFLEQLKRDVLGLDPPSAMDFVKDWFPKGQQVSRDMRALTEGSVLPAHYEMYAQVQAIENSLYACARVAELCEKAVKHIARRDRKKMSPSSVKNKIFIGHGRSALWRELKDFVQDRLKLPYEEFNRVAVAGVTNIERLSEMLDSAAFALILLTAEDERADGEMQARMNVIHEVGLFQGKLGFRKAIVLLEHGCAEFSNIQGLGQIRFPKGNVAACFDEIRKVLEREGIV